MEATAQWSDENQLRIAFEKCLVLHLEICNPRTRYFIGQTEIQSANSVRDLGVIMQHVQSFTNTVLRSFGLLHVFQI